MAYLSVHSSVMLLHVYVCKKEEKHGHDPYTEDESLLIRFVKSARKNLRLAEYLHLLFAAFITYTKLRCTNAIYRPKPLDMRCYYSLSSVFMHASHLHSFKLIFSANLYINTSAFALCVFITTNLRIEGRSRCT